LAVVRSHGLDAAKAEELAEMKRIYGSVKNPNGNIRGKLERLDTIDAQKEEQERAERTELENAKLDMEKLSKENERLSREVVHGDLRVGLLLKNLERSLPDSDKTAVFPEFLDLNVVSKFEGGNKEELDAFVEKALESQAERQARIAGYFRPASDSPGSGKAPAATARGDRRDPTEEGSPIKEAFGWKDRAVTTFNPLTEGKRR